MTWALAGFFCFASACSMRSGWELIAHGHVVMGVMTWLFGVPFGAYAALVCIDAGKEK